MNYFVFQGLVSRIGTSKIVEVNDRRPTGSNPTSRNAEVKEQQPSGSNAASNNAVVKEQRPIVEDQRPTVETTDRNQIAGTNAGEDERHSVGATVVNQSSVENQQRPITCSPVDEQPHTVKDAKATEQRPSAKSLKNERPLSARDVKATERRSVANSDVDERPLSVRDAQANERRSVTNPDKDDRLLLVRDVKANERRSSAKSVVDERPALARDARMSERRPGTNAASRNSDVEDPRPVGTSAILDEQRSAIKNTEANQRRLASSTAAGKNADAAERYSAAKTGAMNERSVADANAVSKSGALYERRVPRPSAPASKDELEEQLELDRRIQELIESNPRLASKETSCTKCGAYGHVVGDCKRKDNRRKCYSCLQFVDDHVASTCPHWNECAALSRSVQPRTSGKFLQESRESKSTPSMKPPPSPPPLFGHSRFVADKRQFSVLPEILLDDDDEEEEDDLPLVDGLRQVYHIRRRVTTKKLKTGRTARKDLIFTDSDFYTDVEYREMFIEEDEEEPGDIILETIKVMSTNPK